MQRRENPWPSGAFGLGCCYYFMLAVNDAPVFICFLQCSCGRMSKLLFSLLSWMSPFLL